MGRWGGEGRGHVVSPPAQLVWVCICSYFYQVPPGHGKSWNIRRPFSGPEKSWKIAKVMESHGKW